MLVCNPSLRCTLTGNSRQAFSHAQLRLLLFRNAAYRSIACFLIQICHSSRISCHWLLPMKYKQSQRDDMLHAFCTKDRRITILATATSSNALNLLQSPNEFALAYGSYQRSQPHMTRPIDTDHVGNELRLCGRTTQSITAHSSPSNVTLDQITEIPNDPTSPPHSISTLPNSGTRILIACRNRIVDIDQNARIRSLISARQRDRRTRRPEAPASNSDLRAGDVELCPASGARGVDGNVLGAQEVVARRQGLRDREGEGRLVLRGEGDLAGAEGWTKLGDFEPRRAAVGGAGAGDFGHVEGWGKSVFVGFVQSTWLLDVRLPVTLWW